MLANHILVPVFLDKKQLLAFPRLSSTFESVRSNFSLDKAVTCHSGPGCRSQSLLTVGPPTAPGFLVEPSRSSVSRKAVSRPGVQEGDDAAHHSGDEGAVWA